MRRPRRGQLLALAALVVIALPLILNMRHRARPTDGDAAPADAPATESIATPPPGQPEIPSLRMLSNMLPLRAYERLKRHEALVEANRRRIAGAVLGGPGKGNPGALERFLSAHAPQYATQMTAVEQRDRSDPAAGDREAAATGDWASRDVEGTTAASLDTPCPHPRRVVAILSEGRGGSTAIGGLFDAHPDVMFIFEPLYPSDKELAASPNADVVRHAVWNSLAYLNTSLGALTSCTLPYDSWSRMGCVDASPARRSVRWRNADWPNQVCLCIESLVESHHAVGQSG